MKKRILGMVLCVCMVLSLITVAAFADGHVYRVVGTPGLCGSSWLATDDDNRMTYNEETGRFEKVYTDVAAGSIPGYEYKIVVDGVTWIPDGSGPIPAVYVEEDNATVTIWYDENTGEWGADVAVGDGQSLGIPMAFGGPSVGYMCCTEKLMRKMPGRIVGKTVDNRGQRVFVLTLQAREQHIRRQKATSNICSNESLMALFVTIYMSVMGKEGVKEAAQMSYDGAHYLHDALIATGLFSDKYERPFFNEFCVKYNGDVDRLQQRFIENGILGGVKVDADTLMFAVTEKRTKEEIDKLVNIAKEEKL